VQRLTLQLAAADKGKPQPAGILASIEKTVQGDKHQIMAAKQLLLQQALTLAADGRTVILAIGTDADSTKVQTSLAGVRRKVRFAFANRDFADAQTDNTVLRAGLAGSLTDAASNLWVFLPRAGAPKRDRPDQTLSTKVATPTLWNGLFASAGDAIDVNQVKSLVAKRDTTSAGANIAGTDRPAATATGPVVGDVVVPKIGNVKILAEPSADAKVLGTVQKSDELVVTAAMEKGFVKVEGATVSGWINALLVAKR
jgi:hypothetical protein